MDGKASSRFSILARKDFRMVRERAPALPFVRIVSR
jgi:hypothetical protein